MPFCIKEIGRIVIYGGGERTEKYMPYLETLGKLVDLIIDQNPKQIQKIFPYRKVVKLADTTKSDYENAMVIIALQNGMLHDEVAERIYKKGCNRILFLPTLETYLLGGEMQKCYCSFLEMDFSEETEIPYYEEMQEGLKENNIILGNENRLTGWISKEFVFGVEKNTRWFTTSYELYLDRNISCLVPYITLFRYISNESTNVPAVYLNQFRPGDPAAQKKLLEDRYKLWCVYEEKMNRSPEYFLQAPPTAHWNENGYFNIEDGHHRSTYLMLKGWYEFPLRVSKKDYDAYVEYSRKQKWHSVAKSIRKEWNRVASALLQWLVKSRIEPARVLDLSETAGYFAWQIEKTSKVKTEVLSVLEIDETKKDCYDIVVLPFREEDENIRKKWLAWHIGKYIVAEQSFMQNFPEYRQVFCLYQGFFDEKQKTIGVFEYITDAC